MLWWSSCRVCQPVLLISSDWSRLAEAASCSGQSLLFSCNFFCFWTVWPSLTFQSFFCCCCFVNPLTENSSAPARKFVHELNNVVCIPHLIRDGENFGWCRKKCKKAFTLFPVSSFCLKPNSKRGFCEPSVHRSMECGWHKYHSFLQSSSLGNGGKPCKLSTAFLHSFRTIQHTAFLLWHLKQI